MSPWLLACRVGDCAAAVRLAAARIIVISMLFFILLLDFSRWPDLFKSQISKSLNDVHCIDAQLGCNEGLGVLAQVWAAVDAVIFLEMGKAHVDAAFCLNTPMGRENPGVAVEDAGAECLALAAMVLEAGIESEGIFHVALVEACCQGIESEEVTFIHRAKPVAGLRGNEDMTPLHLVALSASGAFAKREEEAAAARCMMP